MQRFNEELRIIQKNIGNNIHETRLRKKITLNRLSRLTGLSMRLIDQYEMGKNNLRIRELFKISSALDVEIEHLLEK